MRETRLGTGARQEGTEDEGEPSEGDLERRRNSRQRVATGAELLLGRGHGARRMDSLTIDMQHGPVDYGSLMPMLQAISTTETVPVVRVPWNDPGLIMRVLDAGCYAVICPMINTREEAEAFVGACRYPPYGYRSYGPYRATLYGGPDYPTTQTRPS